MAENAYADNVYDDGRGMSEEEDAQINLRVIVDSLAKEADRRVSARKVIEDRWLLDQRQYNGQYDPDTEGRLAKDTTRSAIFVNKTKPKTDAWAGKIGDMLFPTDDRNWGIKPTPVPELEAQARKVARGLMKIKQAVDETVDGAQGGPAQPGAMPQPPDPAQDPDIKALEDMKQDLESRLLAAKEKADGMQDHIDDQLIQSRYNIIARDIIEDACQAGAGVLKGPVPDDVARKRWQEVETQDETGRVGKVYELTRRANRTDPSITRVDYWNFFPSPEAVDLSDSDGTYERHVMTARDVRRLKHRPGFNEDALRRLLKEGRTENQPYHVSQIRTANGNESGALVADRYIVWEFHGCLTAQQIADISMARNDPSIADTLPDDPDPLDEVNVIVWFCNGELLKFGMSPLDSEEPIYSMFRLHKDQASVWGFGIPWVLRATQSFLNSAWRMLSDNAGLSSGPQVVINQSALEPENGEWVLTPRKIWVLKSASTTQGQAFEVVNIDAHMEELIAAIQLADEALDQVGAMPDIAQGDPGSTPVNTAHGMTILMNSANIVFRRVVKSWDDDITNGVIGRFYHWNMQFSDREDIKGDYEVDARGTSVLLARELQAQNLMAAAMSFSAHPVIGQWIKSVELVRQLFRSMMLNPDDIVMTDDEIKAAEAAKAGQPPPPDPEVMKLEVQMNIAQMETETRLQVAQMEHERAMMELAGRQNITLDQIRADLQKAETASSSKERMMAAEVALTQQIGPTGGGNF